jgi:hypothetical protein
VSKGIWGWGAGEKENGREFRVDSGKLYECCFIVVSDGSGKI